MLSLTKGGDSWRLAARARRDACKAPPPGPALGLGRMLNDSARSPQRYTSRPARRRGRRGRDRIDGVGRLAGRARADAGRRR